MADRTFPIVPINGVRRRAWDVPPSHRRASLILASLLISSNAIDAVEPTGVQVSRSP